MDSEEIQALVEKGVDLAPVETSADSAGMTLRERYRRAMFFQSVDQLPNFEFGYWAETLSEWHQQGLPPEVKDEASAYQYFGIENWRGVWANVGGLLPQFEYKVLSENQDTMTYVDAGSGCVAEINKTGHKSIPHYIDFALKDRKSWEEQFKPRLQASPARLPANLPELIKAFVGRDYPLSVNMGSLIGVPRNWIGFENIAFMVYDDPELLEEIVETLCELICATLEPLLKEIEFDFAAGWEDICFNSGPIVGVDFIRDIVTPRYRRITSLLRKHGCQVAWTDCDGNILPIVDCFLDGGINCMFPVEVHGGSDPVKLRQKHPDIRLQGGFCKMRLTDKQAIRAEMERLAPLVRAGGFIPGVDHRVQADVPLENYQYYLELKRELFGVGGEPRY